MLTATRQSIANQFCSVEDPRRDQGKRHPFINLIVMALAAVICHADSWPEVEEFVKTKEQWFRTFLDMPYGVPSQYTFRRLFLALDPEQFQTSFLSWVKQVEVVTEGDIVAIDGKTLRRAFQTGNKKSAIHMVHAWSQANSLLLGQIKVDEKSNEITAIPKLLEMLHLKGCIVTIDAMGCQVDIAKKVVESDADYLLALKQNQGTLHADVDHLFQHSTAENFQQPQMDYVKKVESGHGRVEVRECWVIGDPEWLAHLRRGSEWPNLNSIIKVQATRSTDDKRRKVDTRYYISSLPVDASKTLETSRAHWEVENKLSLIHI